MDENWKMIKWRTGSNKAGWRGHPLCGGRCSSSGKLDDLRTISPLQKSFPEYIGIRLQGVRNKRIQISVILRNFHERGIKLFFFDLHQRPDDFSVLTFFIQSVDYSFHQPGIVLAAGNMVSKNQIEITPEGGEKKHGRQSGPILSCHTTNRDSASLNLDFWFFFSVNKRHAQNSQNTTMDYPHHITQRGNYRQRVFQNKRALTLLSAYYPRTPYLVAKYSWHTSERFLYCPLRKGSSYQLSINLSIGTIREHQKFSHRQEVEIWKTFLEYLYWWKH